MKITIREWKDGNEYNEAKDHFIKKEEWKAIEWYHGLNLIPDPMR